MISSLVRRQTPLSVMADLDLFTLLSDPFSDTGLKSHVKNNNDSYVFILEVPGFDEDEIDIDVRDRTLTITAEHKDSNDKYFHTNVKRIWSLPRNINEDTTSATLKNGILTVTIPKKEASDGKKVKLLKK